MRKLKTLHVDSEMKWGGGQRQVAGLCTYLSNEGHGVTIVCRPGSMLGKWARDHGLEAIPVDMPSSLSLASLVRLRRVFLQQSPDVVHLHSSRAHLLGSAAARLAKTQHVVATRRMDCPVRMVWPNTCAYGGWVESIVAVSDAVKESLVAAGAAPEKIRVIDSGADVGRYSSARPDPSIRESLGVARSATVIFAAATLGQGKGVRYLLEALEILVARGVLAHAIIAGDGAERASLEEYTSQAAIPASFVGFQPDTSTLVASCDIFVMPSLNEGLGVAALEAMAAGKPVVASAVGGLRESVLDGQTGILVPPADAAALASALETLICDPDRRARFGEMSKRRAAERYSIEVMARRNEALYYELVGE